MLCTREVTVQVPDGLHHQTAARFIQTANRFYQRRPRRIRRQQRQCQKPAGCALPVHRSGTRITITADGADAGEALDALEQCLAGA